MDPCLLFSDVTHEYLPSGKFSIRKNSELPIAYFKMSYNNIAIAPWNAKLGTLNMSIFSLNREISSFHANGGRVPVINNLLLPIKVQPLLFLRKKLALPNHPLIDNSSFICSMDQENNLLAKLVDILESSSLNSEEAKSIMETYSSSSSSFCLLVSRLTEVKASPTWVIIRFWKTNPEDLNQLLPINSVFSVLLMF